jgi:hypothetical protein
MKADLNTCAVFRMMIRYRAAQYGHAGAVSVLIAGGAKLNQMTTADVPGLILYPTSLHAASGSGHAEVVKVLLEAGADASIRSKHGKTAEECADENKAAVLAAFKAFADKAAAGAGVFVA